jgi:hypothetical protein
MHAHVSADDAGQDGTILRALVRLRGSSAAQTAIGSRSIRGADAHAHGSLGIAHGRALSGRPALNHTIRVMPAHLAMSVTCIMFGDTRLNHPVGS